MKTTFSRSLTTVAVMLLIALLLITFIPQISLWLPSLFGYAV